MTSLILFKDMLVDDNVVPDKYTYTFVLKACGNVGCVGLGEQVYGHVVKSGVDEDSYICNTLIHFYAKNGEFGDARKVLDEMCVKDVVSWNAVLSVYCEMGMMEDAREFFGEMGVRNVESWNFIVSGYVKEGMVEEARRVFDEMGVKDVVSWNVMITGYARNGEFDEVFRLFEDMRKDGVVPDDYTFVNVLSCCASVSGLSQGEWIHAYIDKNGIEVGGFLATALVDMYLKCGCLEKAMEVFHKTSRKDISTWNSMIAGLVSCMLFYLDYKVHRDEIHTKLVQIMRERLLLHSRGLPQIIETWNRADETDLQPSQFAKSLTKEVGFLQRVLSKTLHEADVLEIFKEVTIIFDIQISDAFSSVNISIPQARARLNRDLQHILACIRSLPSARLNEPGTPIAGQLESLLQRTAVEAYQ